MERKSRTHGMNTARKTWRLAMRRVESWHDPEQVFIHLFGDAEHAFWLDSSSVVEGLSRFSYMGASSRTLYHEARDNSSVGRAKPQGALDSRSGIFSHLGSELAAHA